MTTALIVDDEPLARSRMRRLLEKYDVRIIAEADNGAMALQQAEDLQPDLLFLDIQMPGLTGMQLAGAILHLDRAPLIVFVTGYSEHTLYAFEHGALDYLVKPVKEERLAVTLARVRERLADRQARTQAQEDVRKQIEPSPATLRSLPTRADYAVHFVALNKILYLFGRDKKVYAQTAEGEHRTYYTLTQLEALLPSDRFFRIHDSFLINLDEMVELLFLGDHTYEVRMTDKKLLRVGRTRYAELQRRLGLSNHPSV
ncbi:MAG: alginate biosynthesis regulatory protein [Chthonomonadaceae bacterium]|nr:alginate biosynthesis regulatory protein [Chthonomonadaceae bacterium]